MMSGGKSYKGIPRCDWLAQSCEGKTPSVDSHLPQPRVSNLAVVLFSNILFQVDLVPIKISLIGKVYARAVRKLFLLSAKRNSSQDRVVIAVMIGQSKNLMWTLSQKMPNSLV